MSLSNAPGSSPEHSIESIIEAELGRIKLDRARFLSVVGVNEEEIQSAMNDPSLRSVFSLDVTSSLETSQASVWALEWYISGFRWLPEVRKLPAPPATLKEILSAASKEKNSLNPTLKIALWKLTQLNPESPIYKHLETKWTTIASIPVPSELRTDATPLWNGKTGEVSPIKDFLKENWPKWAVLAWGAFALYKIFSGKGDEKGDNGKWFFEKLTKWVPGGKLTLGTAVILWGLYYFFWDKIKAFLWIVEKYKDSAGKIMSIPETIGKIADPKVPLPKKKQHIADAVKSLGKVARDALRDIWRQYGIDVDVLPSDKDGKESTASPEVVLASRLYQGYYGIVLPYSDLSENEKAIFKWNNARAHKTDILNESYDWAKSKLPELKSELEQLNTQLRPQINARASTIAEEFVDGTHPIYGKLDDIDSRLADPSKFSPTERAWIGWDASKLSSMPVEERRKAYFHFLARQEVNTRISSLEYRIIAIEAGPHDYEALRALRWDPSIYHEQLRILEDERVAQKLSIWWKTQNIDGRDWARFRDLTERMNEALADKDKVVGKLLGEIDELNTKFNNMPSDSPERAIIVAEVERKRLAIVGIETEAQGIAAKLFSENEKTLVQILNNDKTPRTLISKLLHHLPSRKNWDNWYKWNASLPEHLKDFNLFKTNNRYLRFGSVGTGLALIWVWAGIAWIQWHSATETAKRIAAWFVPVLWTWLDFKDFYTSLTEKDFLWAWANFLSGVASGIGDAILWLSIATGIGTPLWVWAKTALAWVGKAIRTGMKIEGITSTEDILNGWKIAFKMTDGKGKMIEVPVNLTPEQARRYLQYNDMLETWRSAGNNWKDVLTGTNGKRVMLLAGWWSLAFTGVALTSAYIDGGKVHTITPRI